MRAVSYTNRECLYCKKKFKIKTTYTRYENAGLFCSRGCKSSTKGYGNKKHGMSSSKEYRSWQGMKRRTTDPKNSSYNRYGARGITVCDRWLNSFDNFLEDMGERPDGYEIDRIDNNGNYSPENCRWVTPKENRRNRRSSKFIEFNGEIKNLSAWAEEYGIKYITVYQRLTHGWSIKKSLQTPVQKKLMK